MLEEDKFIELFHYVDDLLMCGGNGAKGIVARLRNDFRQVEFPQLQDDQLTPMTMNPSLPSVQPSRGATSTNI